MGCALLFLPSPHRSCPWIWLASTSPWRRPLGSACAGMETTLLRSQFQGQCRGVVAGEAEHSYQIYPTNFDVKRRVFFCVCSTYHNQTCGLCGDYDGSPSNDFTKPDGAITTNVNDFGNSWQTEEDEDDSWVFCALFILSETSMRHCTISKKNKENSVSEFLPDVILEEVDDVLLCWTVALKAPNQIQSAIQILRLKWWNRTNVVKLQTPPDPSGEPIAIDYSQH